MKDLKTVEGNQGDNSLLDPLYAKQKEGVAKMRASLLACSNDPTIAKQAINNITVLRIYHQIARIIKYTEMCDKIEQKIYDSLDKTMEKMNDSSPGTWMMLLKAQERLQKLLIDSHKMLQPYLELEEHSIVELTQSIETTTAQPISTGLNAEARDRLRLNAQNVLLQLDARGSGD